jgi:hypothetical protein
MFPVSVPPEVRADRKYHHARLGNNIMTCFLFQFHRKIEQTGSPLGQVGKEYIVLFPVSVPPEVRADRKYHHARLGDNVTLVCIVFANPPAKVQSENMCRVTSGDAARQGRVVKGRSKHR